ncbi:MAG: hypothetical protein BWY79_00475 [Actinobacteria bacterium ADurb.Bin444]|nr:MAG: hypothetical protein BWY79_00475 [Actinobacteria bacterium ADurb.Bin444]
MFHDRHQHSAREVFVTLEDIDILGSQSGHRVQARRRRLEVGRGVVGRIVYSGRLPVARALYGRQHVRGLLSQSLGPFSRYHDQRRRPIVLHTAVVKMERLHNPARLVVDLLRQRAPVHDRARVTLRVRIARERNGSERPLPDTVLPHEAAHTHGKHLGRRHQAIGSRECLRARRHRRTCPLAVAVILTLRQAAEHDHRIGETGGHRSRSVGHSSRAAATTATPHHGAVAEFR